jgi:hypothetical protein
MIEAITFSNKGYILENKSFTDLAYEHRHLCLFLMVHLLSIMDLIQAPHLSSITFLNARYNRVQDRDGEYTETIISPLAELTSIEHLIIKMRSAEMLMPRILQKSISTLDVTVKHELALFRSSSI